MFWAICEYHINKVPPAEMTLAERLNRELTFTASRSDGPGGQNVNKVNSKITLKFDVLQSSTLSGDEKENIIKRLGPRLTKEGVLILSAQDSRSQLMNKEAVILKFEKILSSAFQKRKVRKSTKPTKSSVQERIQLKKRVSEKKKWRQKP
jgi:ribosome-associated protein